MYWTKRLLAHAGILRVVDVKYNDGKIWQGEIVDEDSEHFCIKAFQMWGLYGRRLCNWVPKSDPGIGNVRWNDRAKLTLTAALLLIAAAPYVAVYQIASVSDSIADIDSFTGLPVADHIYYPDLLPDGHYTVVKATSSGATIIVRHQPGPDRNFVYYVNTCVGDNVPNHPTAGRCFQVFRSHVVS